MEMAKTISMADGDVNLVLEKTMKLASHTMQRLALAIVAAVLLTSASNAEERHNAKAGTIEIPAEQIACTGGVAIQDATFDGRPVLWQVMDFSSGYSQLWKYRDSTVEVLHYGLDPKSMAHSLNSHGLARAVNEQRTLDFDDDRAWYPLRVDLDRKCTSIADVRRRLAAKDYDGGKSFPFIDATGKGTMFEVADQDFWEYYPVAPSRLRNPDYDYSDPYNFINRAFDLLRLFGLTVVERPSDDSLPANRQLQEHARWRAGRLAVVRDREHTQRHPLVILSDFCSSGRNSVRLLSVLIRRSDRILSVITSIGSRTLTIRSCILPVVPPIPSRVLTVCSRVLSIVNSISTVLANRALA